MAPSGVAGLLTGKKAYLLGAYGGGYGEGSPMASFNFVEPYLRTILGFIGVTDVTFVNAEQNSKVSTRTSDAR